MRYPELLIALLLAGITAGCGGDRPLPVSSEPATTEQTEGAPEQDLIRMRTTEFYLYDARPLAGAARKPLIFIRAGETSVGVDSGASVSFKDAQAVIRSNEEAGQEIIFRAAEGSFVENERAYLGGGVVAQVGEMTVQLEDIEMTSPSAETELVAETQQPVIIDGPGLHLQAASMRLYPDDKICELTAGSGYLEFGSLEP